MYYADERFSTKQRHQELNCQWFEHKPTAVSFSSQPELGSLLLYIASAVGLSQYAIS